MEQKKKITDSHVIPHRIHVQNFRVKFTFPREKPPICGVKWMIVR